MNEWSIRVTPPNGKEVEFILDEFDQFIACKEIGKKHKKLHYHIYCKTTLNHNSKGDSEIRDYLQLICNTNAKGNGFFSCVEAHDGSKGYVVKEQLDVDSIVAHKGFTDDELSTILAQSKQYRSDKETERKEKYRNQQKTQIEVVASVVASLEGVAADAALITRLILSQYRDSGELMPTRSAFERIFNTVIATKYGIQNNALEMYYLPRVYIDEGRDSSGDWFKTPIKFY